MSMKVSIFELLSSDVEMPEPSTLPTTNPARKARQRFTMEQKWNIVQELKAQRMVQSELAKKYNTSQENISRWCTALGSFKTLYEAQTRKYKRNNTF
jgi:transposase-like protein